MMTLRMSSLGPKKDATDKNHLLFHLIYNIKNKLLHNVLPYIRECSLFFIVFIMCLLDVGVILCLCIDLINGRYKFLNTSLEMELNAGEQHDHPQAWLTAEIVQISA
jgi:hypothetical protein